MARKRWFQEVVAKRKRPTGWRKSDPPWKRRRAMLRSHRGNALSAARACQALANVTKDPETKRKARMDAKYFYRMHRKTGR